MFNMRDEGDDVDTGRGSAVSEIRREGDLALSSKNEGSREGRLSCWKDSEPLVLTWSHKAGNSFAGVWYCLGTGYVF